MGPPEQQDVIDHEEMGEGGPSCPALAATHCLLGASLAASV